MRVPSRRHTLSDVSDRRGIPLYRVGEWVGPRLKAREVLVAIRPEYPTPDQGQGQPPRIPQPPANGPAWAAPPRSAPRPPAAQSPYTPYATPTAPRQAPATPPRRTKADSLDLIRRLKGWLIAGSLVAFGVIGLLVKGNVTGVTAASNTGSESPSSPPSSTQQQQPSSGGYFGQQGGSNFGPSNNSGGLGGGSFGSSSVS